MITKQTFKRHKRHLHDHVKAVLRGAGTCEQYYKPHPLI